MKTQSVLLAALASAPAALAHTVFTDFFVDGVPQGDGVAIRMNPNAAKASSPIASLDSDDMACNVGGTKGVSRVQPVKDGALLTFEIRSWPNDPTKERLDRGHKGPCAVYLKKVADASTDKAAGDGWFKIFDHGYDALYRPLGLEGGDYLARPEILALHAANDNDPQFYTGCAQIFLESSGNLVPESTVSIPGYVKYGQPSTDFDIYNTPGSKYVVPGPKVAKLTAGGTQKASTTQADGLKPEGCIMENANWCGKEVSSYNTEKGCWASAQECWDQSDVCFNTSPATGNAGCKIWQDKRAIDVGKIMATVGGGIVDAAPKTSSAKKETPAKATPMPVADKVVSAAPKPTVDMTSTHSSSYRRGFGCSSGAHKAQHPFQGPCLYHHRRTIVRERSCPN
ncbi:unnamed protein product [Alternaria alternata]